jgi:hypothetical protein
MWRKNARHEKHQMGRIMMWQYINAMEDVAKQWGQGFRPSDMFLVSVSRFQAQRAKKASSWLTLSWMVVTPLQNIFSYIRSTYYAVQTQQFCGC